jgi:hypothetical protein
VSCLMHFKADCSCRLHSTVGGCFRRSRIMGSEWRVLEFSLEQQRSPHLYADFVSLTMLETILITCLQEKTNQFKRLTEAYRVLSTTHLRQTYDNLHAPTYEEQERARHTNGSSSSSSNGAPYGSAQTAAPQPGTVSGTFDAKVQQCNTKQCFAPAYNVTEQLYSEATATAITARC